MNNYVSFTNRLNPNQSLLDSQNNLNDPAIQEIIKQIALNQQAEKRVQDEAISSQRTDSQLWPSFSSDETTKAQNDAITKESTGYQNWPISKPKLPEQLAILENKSKPIEADPYLELLNKGKSEIEKLKPTPQYDIQQYASDIVKGFKGKDEAKPTTDILGALGAGAGNLAKLALSPTGLRVLGSLGNNKILNAAISDTANSMDTQAATANNQYQALMGDFTKQALFKKFESGSQLGTNFKEAFNPTTKQNEYYDVVKNQWTGIIPETKPSTNINLENRMNNSESNLKKEFNSLPEVKAYKTVTQFYNRLKNTPDTAAGDLTTIFSYMKILDPESVVREGEQASAQNTAGVPDQIRNAYNKVLSGNRLNPKQRSDFKAAADKIINGNREIYSQRAAEYEGYARDYGFNPKNIVGVQEPISSNNQKSLSVTGKDSKSGKVQLSDGRVITMDDAKKLGLSWQ